MTATSQPNVTLVVEPRHLPSSWEDFVRTSPPFSIALDGYVRGAPRFDPAGPRANFNHHEDVARFETRATCGQVLLAVRTGLFRTFQESDVPTAVVHVNDCDEDVCLSWFILSHPERSARVRHGGRLSRIVGANDLLDTSAGLYPFPIDQPILEELAWVFEPYRSFRLSGEIDAKNPAAFARILDDVGQRVTAHLEDRGDRLPLSMDYEVIGGGPGWTLVREIGLHARARFAHDGIDAFVSVRERSGGGWMATVCRRSKYVPFDVPGILAELDRLEGPSGRHWGGGETVGGSAQATGTLLSPRAIEAVVNSVVART